SGPMPRTVCAFLAASGSPTARRTALHLFDVVREPADDGLRRPLGVRTADLRARQVGAPDGHGARTVRGDDVPAVDDLLDALAGKLAAAPPRDQRDVRNLHGERISHRTVAPPLNAVTGGAEAAIEL